MSFNIRFDADTAEKVEPEKKQDTGDNSEGDSKKHVALANRWNPSDEPSRRDLALKVISDFDPDILGVQEALKNQVDDLKGLLSDHGFYGVGRDDGVEKGEYCGIFYRDKRFTKVKQGTFWLNEKSDEPGSRFEGTCCARIASWIILKDMLAGKQEYLVLNTHWDHQSQAARDFSSQLIRQRLMKIAEGRPVILLGDLNTKPDSAAYRSLITNQQQTGPTLLDSYREAHPMQLSNEATFHGFRGRVDGDRIDYVFHSPEFYVSSAQIIRTNIDRRYPSDHYPVTATLVPRAK